MGSQGLDRFRSYRCFRWDPRLMDAKRSFAARERGSDRSGDGQPVDCMEVRTVRADRYTRGGWTGPLERIGLGGRSSSVMT